MLLSEAAKLFQTRLLGSDIHFSGCTTDSRRVQEGNLFIALRGEHFDGHDFIDKAKSSGAVAAVIESDANLTLPILKVANSREAMGQLSKYWREKFTIPVVAVTGSNGKTTVKEMIKSILAVKGKVLATQGNLNNDIGVPLTLFGLGEGHQFMVIEMGANHPGEISLLTRIVSPTVALITQCAPSHLVGFGTVEGVARAKAEIYEGLDKDSGLAIINKDDSFCSVWKEKASLYKQIYFGKKGNADIYATDILFNSDSSKTEFKLYTPQGTITINLSLPGNHNIDNALAASSCCIAIDIPLSSIKIGLENMKSAKGRLQIKKGWNNSVILDDTYNANPASLLAALNTLSTQPGKHWLVLGDMRELGESAVSLHYQTGELARGFGIERMFGLGQLSRHAVEGFGAGAQHFSSISSLIRNLRDCVTEDVRVLVKGSRFMAMERLVDELEEGDL